MTFLVRNLTQGRRALTRIEVDLVCLDTLLSAPQTERFWRWLSGYSARRVPAAILIAPKAASPSSLPSFFDSARSGLVEKPLEAPALEAEVTRLLLSLPRRARRAELVRAGSLALDVATNQLLLGDGSVLSITPTEARLMRALMQHPGEYLTHEQLLEEVWDYQPGTGSAEVVRAHVSNFRRKLRSVGGNPQLVRTSYRGYGFICDDVITRIKV
jgi:DNA-binding response OmpR family regulator